MRRNIRKGSKSYMKKSVWRGLLVCAVFLFVSSSVFGQNTEEKIDYLKSGIEKFTRTEYNAALLDFREIILSQRLKDAHGDGYFWIAKCYIALGQLDEAEKNLEYFLINFKGNQYYPESYYQKGRLLYLQGEYEKSLEVLQSFLESYKDSPFASNALYWVGENLYSLGMLDEALNVFHSVVETYPTSFKVEAAGYRISLIELKKRERELLKLLKWSHEESLKTLEEFQKREKTYEQALATYQRKLSLISEKELETELQKLEKELRTKNAENESLVNEINSLKQSSANLSAQLDAAKAELAKVSVPAQDTARQPTPAPQPGIGPAGADSAKRLENTKRLLDLKEKALAVREAYVDMLLRMAESR